MKTLKHFFFALSFLAVSTAAVAKGNEAKPMATAAALKADVVSKIQDFDINALSLTDETVEIAFLVNDSGELVVSEVAGDNCLVNAYIAQMLKNKKLKVDETLKNEEQRVTVRYVII